MQTVTDVHWYNTRNGESTVTKSSNAVVDPGLCLEGWFQAKTSNAKSFGGKPPLPKKIHFSLLETLHFHDL